MISGSTDSLLLPLAAMQFSTVAIYEFALWMRTDARPEGRCSVKQHSYFPVKFGFSLFWNASSAMR